MRRIVILIAASVFLLLVPGRAWADTLTLLDGTHVSGVLVSRTASQVIFRNAQGVSHRYKTKQIQSLEITSTGQYIRYNQNPRNNPNNRNYKLASSNDRQPELLPAGTQLVILTNEAIDSKIAASNQLFSAQVDQDVIDSSNELIVPRGSPAQLIIRSVSSGGVTGSPEITLDIQSITVNGRRYNVTTADLTQKGSGGIGANKRTAEMIGGGAVIGTIIGAIVGHGKGAAIGAAVGAAGGAGAQVLTKGKQVIIPAETVLKFRLDQDVTLAPER